ncbi:MAG TPA: hypothetical protein VJT80_09105 [Steroidobacteraceae bacterium]|nr:hypothetical protein [Steroidobacteraceae bacterium]
MSEQKRFHVVTVGWDMQLIRSICNPLEPLCQLQFTHAVVHPFDAAAAGPDARVVRVGMTSEESVPPPDYELLASLECAGVPTVRTMILGDRVLRHRPELEALGYITVLARRLRDALVHAKPDLVLGGFDQAHSMLGLAVAKSLDIPWVTMAFSVIPENLVGFCRRLTPNALIAELARPVTPVLRGQAREVMEQFRARRMRVFVFRPATSLRERLAHMAVYGRNLVRRLLVRSEYSRFVYPTARERFTDIVRRHINALTLPEARFLRTPGSQPFVFFPLQMKPEMSTETQAPFFQDQIALVRQLADAVPIGLEFVVKLHLSDPDNYSRELLGQLLQIPGLRIAHPSASSFQFLERAALVFGITGTPCLEAALLGKPVIIFGDSPYVHFPRSERAAHPDELCLQIQRLIALPPPSDDEIVEAYATYIARYLPGRINDWGRPIEPDELSALADCFRALRLCLESPGQRAGWYRQSPFAAEVARWR